MNKEEILEKSRAVNRNKDVYEQEVLKQGGLIRQNVYETANKRLLIIP